GGRSGEGGRAEPPKNGVRQAHLVVGREVPRFRRVPIREMPLDYSLVIGVLRVAFGAEALFLLPDTQEITFSGSGVRDEHMSPERARQEDGPHEDRRARSGFTTDFRHCLFASFAPRRRREDARAVVLPTCLRVRCITVRT